MELKKLVEIINNELEWNYEIIGHNNPSNDLVYRKESALYVRSDLPMSIFSLVDGGGSTGKGYISDTYSTGNLEFYNELFIAIDTIIRKVYDCDVRDLVKNVNACTKKVREEIISNLDFSEISNMETLIETVKNNMHYATLLFMVRRHNCIEEHQSKSYNDKPIEFIFGNRNYRRDMDVVNIEIFTDFTSLHYRKEGSKHHEEKIDNNSKSVEQEILNALDLWNNYYNN